MDMTDEVHVVVVGTAEGSEGIAAQETHITLRRLREIGVLVGRDLRLTVTIESNKPALRPSVVAKPVCSIQRARTSGDDGDVG